MKITRLFYVAALAVVCGFTSCQDEQEEITTKEEISKDVLSQVKAMGFNNQDVQRTEGGYIVEGDIFLSESQLTEGFDTKALRVGESEQYRTNNLVSVGSGRTIRVAITTSLPSSYVAGLDEAVRRYNAQGLRVKFQRVSSNYEILFSKAPSGSTYLASAGFPSNGNPFSSVKVNSDAMGSNPGTDYLATVLAHEAGHCIGFRHTDYMDRSYSCGGSYTNEGASTVGAVHIPGTPTGADPNSWMLACIGTGKNRYFNSNDVTALRYIY